MESNFSVSIPQKGSTVTFESISPEIPPARKTFTKRNKTEHFGMDKLQGDSPLSESQDIKEVYATSVTPPQLEKNKPRKNKSSRVRPSTTKDEVFRVAVTIPRAARHDACPAGFNPQGDLKKAWVYLKKDIEQARTAHITSQEAQRLDSEHVEPAKDHIQQKSTENEQQAHKSSTPYANKRQKPNSNTTDRIIQPAETNGINNRGIFPHTDESSIHSRFPPSNEFASHLLPLVGEGAIDAPTSSPRYTRSNEMQLGPATGANAQPTIIVCSDEGCAKRQFDAWYLGQYCGIDIQDAKKKQQRDQFWLCPECAHKSAVLHGHNNPVTHGSITRLPKFGTKRLEDDFLRGFLRQLSGLLTGYSAKAANKSTVPNLQMPVWDIPCVRDEVLNPVAGRVNHFVSQLRQLLDVPDGVTIKNKVDHYQLHGYRNSLWVQGVLVSLFSDAVFRQGSPFESDDILHQSLEYAGLQPDLVQSISQDCRTRTFMEDDQPKQFSEHLKSRHQSFVQQLNNIMMAIVGCDSVFDSYHRGIADLATELNAHISTDTRGTFREIRPVAGDLFDPQFHRLENRDQDSRNFAGQPVLVTTMVGIKYRLPGREWRVCSPAEVELQRLPVSAGPRKVSRIVPCKRPRPSMEQVDLRNE